MDSIYQVAWKEGDSAIFIDGYDRKYAAKMGNLAWRINNPGLVKYRCGYAKKNGSIGTWDKFAIFSNPHQGHLALKEWLQSKSMLEWDLFHIAKRYHPSLQSEDMKV